jgi:hypothetical protein
MSLYAPARAPVKSPPKNFHWYIALALPTGPGPAPAPGREARPLLVTARRPSPAIHQAHPNGRQAGAQKRPRPPPASGAPQCRQGLQPSTPRHRAPSAPGRAGPNGRPERATRAPQGAPTSARMAGHARQLTARRTGPKTGSKTAPETAPKTDPRNGARRRLRQRARRRGSRARKPAS